MPVPAPGGLDLSVSSLDEDLDALELVVDAVAGRSTNYRINGVRVAAEEWRDVLELRKVRALERIAADVPRQPVDRDR